MKKGKSDHKYRLPGHRHAVRCVESRWGWGWRVSVVEYCALPVRTEANIEARRGEPEESSDGARARTPHALRGGSPTRG